MQPISEYMNRITIFPSIAMSEDGKRIAYISNITGAPQIWIAGVNREGLLSYPKPLTSGSGDQPYAMSNEALAWIGNDRLVALMDHHGDEQTFIRIFNVKTGEIDEVLRHPGSRDFLAGISDDRKKILFTSNRANPLAQGLYTFDLKTGEIESWYQHDSQSCHWVGKLKFKGEPLFVRVHGNGMNTLHTIHPKSKMVTDLFTEMGYLMGPLCEFGKGKLLVLTNYNRQFIGLAVFDPRTKEIEFKGADQWDIEHGDILNNKKSVLLTRNVGGRSQIEIYSLPSLKKAKSLAPAQGVIESLHLSHDGHKATFTFHSANNPRDIYQLDLKTKKFRALTDNWASKVPKSELVQPKPIKYKSQGREIYSWLFLPKSAKKNGKTPVIYWPHGGPQAEERAGFRPIFQYFISRGFALWAPNPTGSSGYGRDFMQAINGQWGTADLPDVENGIQWLRNCGWVDPERMAVMGGSYGGYMTLRALTKFPKVWKAGVDIFGVSNLLTFVKSVPPDWTPFMDVMVGNAERDREKLVAQSPITEIEKIKAPLLVVQGAKDPRVVKAESDQVVERLRKQGTHVDYLVFEDEGHGFLKPDNELKAYARIAEFLEQHL